MYLDGGMKPGNFQPNAPGKQGGKKFALANFGFVVQSIWVWKQTGLLNNSKPFAP
jgi:hypothetical protein